MRIAQITDLHIAQAAEKPFDVDVRGNFLKVLESVAIYDPDLIALTGDLTYHDGDSEACA
jgi:3',5'-cyclic AMP phosphodiesterase CpdA